MGKRCSYALCKSNCGDRSVAKNPKLKMKNDLKNEDRENVPTFGLPKCPEERSRWIQAIPYVSKEDIENRKSPFVLCSKHWPVGFETVKAVNSKTRPAQPPSVFDGTPPSDIPTPPRDPPRPRSTKRSSAEVRMTYEDELKEYLEKDGVHFDQLVSDAQTHEFPARTISYIIDNTLWIQSAIFNSGIPSFSVKIFKDLTYEAFHQGIQCTITTLAMNRIYRFNRWSRIDEAIRFLSTMNTTHHETVLQQHIDSMKPTRVGHKVYSPEVIKRSFDYFATSRCLYEKLRKDYKLPSVKTLSNLTSKVNNLSDKRFIDDVFTNLEERQKQYILLVDEVYVKKALLYHGGELFGKAENNKETLANAVLSIMVKCLFGGPTFIFKMVPVKGMSAELMYSQIQQTLDLIRSAGGQMSSIITDGNRTNQKFFKLFDTVDDKPWLTKDGIFLLFDYVHILKCIRNNWLTELSGELDFQDGGETYTAKWKDLTDLYTHEKDARKSTSGVRSLSALNDVAVAPKPVERQKVSTCLRVFSDETLTALRVHPKIDQGDVKGTTLFIKKVTDLWKIINVRSKDKDERKLDPLQKEIDSADDPRLAYLLEFAEMAHKMKKTGKGKRKKPLTIDTSKALVHTLKGLVELCKHQLATSHQFVLLGQYSTDPLEKEFGKIRQGSGGT